MYLAIHAEQIVEHGGVAGVRDHGLLEAALSQPRNLNAHESPGVFQLAAAYAFGIVHNRPFMYGNKRTAFLVSAAFLEWNSRELTADEPKVVIVFQDIAAGNVSEKELAIWFEAHSRHE